MLMLRNFGDLIARALRQWLARTREGSLRDLDDRTLADIGVLRSEIASIEAEALGRSALTRRRIALAANHG